MPKARRVDPSRTLLIQNKFAEELAARQEWLKEQIIRHVEKADSYGLGGKAASSGIQTLATLARARSAPPKGPLTANEPYRFLTDSGKLKAFSGWLQDQIDSGILKGVGQTDIADPLTIQYIQSAYKQGLIRAYLDSHAEDYANDPSFFTKGQERFLATSFNAPVAKSQVEALATRTFEEMRGFTNTEKTQLGRILADAMANGSSADQAARDMTNQIDGITRTRANVIARTEIVRAHAEGQLDAYEALGATELGVEVEWLTSGDPCEDCADGADESPYTIDEARGLIPMHPNCRCTFAPFVPEAQTQNRTRGRVFNSLFAQEGLRT